MLSRIRSFSALLLVLLSFTSLAPGMDLFGTLSVGYKAGLSFQAATGATNFAQGFPLSMEFGITYSSVDPGAPFPARRIFIADATNGTPEKYGTNWDLRLDFLYNLNIRGPRAIFIFAGPRFSMFDAHFHYVGANEEFDVTSNPWGIGFGVKGMFAISPRVDLTLTGGLDNYFDTSIHGHDTTYNPDNQNVNPHENFTYKDAKAEVNTPRLQGILMLGFTYAF
ncbi:MAG TPA: hypothetical protein VK569_03220 [Bacteroidota bacterium]|nr:hypothetical protein [Bacteroidota bacterium]